LGIAHIGFTDKLTKGNINYVNQAFTIFSGLNDVWHKGRGISAFLTVLGLVGLSEYATRKDHHQLKSLVCYMNECMEDQDRVEKCTKEYVFSILLMINCVSVLNELKYLEYKRDWIKVSQELIETLPINLKAIFSHYFLSTLDNLGLIHRLTNNPQEYLLNIINNLSSSEESEIDYMAYTYCVDISHKLDIVDALPDSLVDKLINNISTLYNFSTGHKPNNMFYRSGYMRIAYTLTALSRMGKVDYLLAKTSSNGTSLIERLIENHVTNWGDSDHSFTTLQHALIDLSLSQRGVSIKSSEIDDNLAIQKDRHELKARNIWSLKNHVTQIHAYFPGMNSRRSYTNISRELYEKGNSSVRSIFEDSAYILSQYNGESIKNNISRFFFEKELSDDNVEKKWNTVGSSMTVYNLALLEHFKTSSNDFFINSVGGESYGMIAAAIASNALSLEDGLKVANYTLGSIYRYAHKNSVGTWHIVSLSGSSAYQQLEYINRTFPHGFDIFRWQKIALNNHEIHAYIHHSIFNEIRDFINNSFNNTIFFTEFKRPTIEIVHSPKLTAARIDISNFFVDENIQFFRPDIPIVANNGTGIASAKDEVRNLILDMVNAPMYSAQSFHYIDELLPANTDAIVEFGYGQKTRPFIDEHGVKQYFFEYFGCEQSLKQTIRSVKSIKHLATISPTPTNSLQNGSQVIMDVAS
jgi:hypothetical protein